jgi:mRNA interferase MazF
MEIVRGDIVVVALSGDYGKPRPALVVQSDAFNPTHSSIVVCPITSHLIEASLFRITLHPSPATGLKSVSQVMVDKLMAIRLDRISKVIGRVDSRIIASLNQALKNWLDVE